LAAVAAGAAVFLLFLPLRCWLGACTRGGLVQEKLMCLLPPHNLKNQSDPGAYSDALLALRQELHGSRAKSGKLCGGGVHLQPCCVSILAESSSGTSPSHTAALKFRRTRPASSFPNCFKYTFFIHCTSTPEQFS
jgi:hypothetical protein